MSQQDFLSELENGKSPMAGGLRSIFGAVLIGLSAITSAAFFFTYAAGTFTFLSPSLSPYLAAVTGVICFEGASVIWTYLSAHDADTKTQLTVSMVGAWGSMLGGLIITAVYFTLNTQLIAPRLDDGSIMVVSIIGGLLIILGIGGNFALGFLYRANSASHKAAEQLAELRAAQSLARHTIKQESTKATLAQTVNRIREDLPQHAARQGAYNAGQFVAATFTQDDPQNGRLQPQNDPVSVPNGNGPA